MLAFSLNRALVVLSLLSLAPLGCGGLLIVEPSSAVPCTGSHQCGLDYVCDTSIGRCVESEGPCSVAFPQGDCPRGTTCVDAVCVCADPEVCECVGDDCGTSWCDCTPAQGCDEGLCVDIITSGPNANSCAPERPSGLCAGARDCCGGACCGEGEACLAGHCVPEPAPCDQAHPQGICPLGLACSGGRCVPEDLCACNSERPQGCCDIGELCTSGSCAAQTCAVGVLGACPQDFACDVTSGNCVRLPCSLAHPLGACPSDEVCGSLGRCLGAGECDTIEDCGTFEYCSVELECLPGDQCLADDDCTVQLASAYGQGYHCVGEACVERVDCASDSDCIEEKFCGELNHCLAEDQCEHDLDCAAADYCSQNGTCVLDGTCGVDGDCNGTDFCATNQLCLPAGSCAAGGDCPPGHACNLSGGGGAGTCEVTGELCDSNAFTTSCAPGQVTCCASGNCCDNANDLCSAAGSCIPVGLCVSDADCLAGFSTCIDYVCVPSQSCLTCVSGQHCASVLSGGQTVSGCVPDGRCFSDADCAANETCNAEHACIPDGTCGAEIVSIGSVVRPNVLIVLDRSGSMNLCGAGDANAGPCGANAGACNATVDCCACNTGSGCQESFSGSGVACECDRDCNASSCACNTGAGCQSGCLCDTDCGFCACNTGPGCQASCACDRDCATTPPLCSSNLCINASCNTGGTGETTPRWDDALQAVNQITLDFQTRARFGLSLYPAPTGSDACSVDCRWTTCSGSTNTNPGDVDVPLADDARGNILAALGGTAPGGHTPTAATLRNVLSDPAVGGLDDPARQNAVLLITDGEATSDTSTVKFCEPACTNVIKDGDETDVDCGGACESCSPGAACARNDDCDSFLCREGLCRAATCGDEVLNGSETDIDCGGACGQCAERLACNANADCQSGLCTSGLCAAPNCGDAIKNGTETGVDCGGACPTDCADGAACIIDEDCLSVVCQGGQCRPATCRNSTFDGDESDTDCGGAACAACPAGDACRTGVDCASGECTTGSCTVPGCKNATRDGDETDVDCGGSCGPCPGGKLCSVDADCAGTCRDCGDGTDQACRVDASIARLYGLAPRVKTFVVGFAFDGTSKNLNCHATYGRTTRRLSDGSCDLTRDDCDADGQPVCYYDANDEASLSGVLNDILDQVSSCTYDLNVPTFGLFGLDLYLQTTVGPSTFAKLRRGTQWTLLPNRTQVELTGSACDTVKAGDAEVVVIYGCPDEG